MVRGCGTTSGQCLRDRLLAMVGEQPGHGYDLCDRLGCIAAGGSDTVAVYRALRALERDGLVASRWDEPVSGPARRVYSVADA
ncbi:MAG TPA: helix-turn-helix transcriptional regulator [Acidimicrobiales bacterium]|nr:helix-turn-helix transcriptional regulator [Acidimicrobiales bacterium]